MKPLKMPPDVKEPIQQFFWELILGSVEEPLVTGDYLLVSSCVQCLCLHKRIIDNLAQSELELSTEGRYSTTKANPLIPQLDKLTSQILKHFDQLGVGPKARKRLKNMNKIVKDEDVEEDNDDF